MRSSVLKNNGNSAVIVIVVLATVALLGWYSLTSTKTNDLETVSTETNQKLDAASAKFLESLNELNSIVIDTSVFQSPAYSQLKDFSRPIMPEPQGRANPFADIDEDSSFASSTNEQLNMDSSDNSTTSNLSGGLESLEADLNSLGDSL